MNTNDILARLAAPFPATALRKRTIKRGSQSVTLSYLTSAQVQERLDQVLGPDGWEFRCEVVNATTVKGQLVLHFPDDRTVVREDFGVSKRPEDPEGLKSAASDCLKRCASLAGVGRYLRLPAWAMPSEPNRRNSSVGGIDPNAEICLDDDEPPNVQADLLRVTENQEQQLAELLRTTGAHVGRFLQHFGIRSVGSLPQADFPRAVQMLRQKAAASPGGPQPAPAAPGPSANGVAPAKGTRKP